MSDQYEHAKNQVRAVFDKLRDEGKNDKEKLHLMNLGEAFALVLIAAAKSLERIAIAIEKATEPTITESPEPQPETKPAFKSVNPKGDANG